MTRTTLGILLAMAAAAAVAWRLGGASGTGVIAGYLCGASVAALAALWQRHWLRVDPRRAFRAFGEGFLFKLAMLLLGALAFRYVPEAAERVDWRSFVLTFSVAMIAIMFLGVLDNATLSRSGPAGLEGRRAL